MTRLGNILHPFGGCSFSELHMDPGGVIVSSRAYDLIYFFTNWCYWLRDVVFGCSMRAQERVILVDRHNRELFAERSLERPCLYARSSSWWEHIECGRMLTVPTPPVLVNYSNFVVNCCSSADAIWPGAGLELVAMALVRLVFAAEHAAVGMSCFDLQKGQGGWVLLFPISASAHCGVDQYGFLSSVRCCAFHSAIAYLGIDTQRNPTVLAGERSFTSSPTKLAGDPVYALLEAVVLWQMRDASRALVEDKVFRARNIV